MTSGEKVSAAYIVVQKGVWRHDIWGPYDLESAKDAARELAAEDRDDYHDYQVFLLDGCIEDLDKPLYTINKGGIQ